MKKTQIKIILSLTILLAITCFTNVYAIPAKGKFHGYRHSTIQYFNDRTGGTSNYNDPILTIDLNGSTYDAFCIDPGEKFSQSLNFSCEPYDMDGGLIWLYEQLLASGGDATTIQLAMRFYAVYNNLNKGTKSPLQKALVRYLQIRGGYAPVVSQYGTDYTKMVFGNNAMIETAYNLALNATSNYKNYSYESGDAAHIKFEIASSTDTTITYNISSVAKIPKEKLSFTCKDCTFVGDPVATWNGNSGTLTVSAARETCAFTIEATYPSAGLFICKSPGQSVLISVGDDEMATQKFLGNLPECNGSNCCTENPIEPGHIEGSINNCCTDDTHSEAKEYELNDLFCYDKDLKVDHYFPKCNADYYIEDDAVLNDYCKMYCTERVTVDIPGAITATSGRYFTLSTTSHGTKSPYIEGFKRCRIRVEYDKWLEDYETEVQKQVDAYNSYQENRAYELMYEKSIANSSQKSETITVTCSVSTNSDSCSRTTTTAGGPVTCRNSITSGSGSAKTKTITAQYTYYPFPKAYYYKWYQVVINDDLKDKYKEIRIENDKKNYETFHATNYSAWDLRSYINEANNFINTYNGKEVPGTKKSSSTCCSVSATSKYSCTRNYLDAENKQENVVQVEQQYHNKAESAQNSYSAATDKAKKLEEDIHKCDNYFTEFEGANAESNYAFDASMAFDYTQVYLDELGNKKMDIQNVPFKDEPGCQIDGPITSPDGEINAPNYSGEYGHGDEIMNDFKTATLSHQTTASGFKSYIDRTYLADKLFTHDAKYHAVCKWDEGDNKNYTLVPTGESSEISSEINYSVHDKEYRVYLTTFDGTYETHWDVNGLGTDGKFDQFFKDNSTTCANENPNDVSMFTCKLHVEYEIVLTGYCNGSNGTDTTVNPDDCDPYDEGMNLFNFRIVDANNIFPAGTTDSETGRKYAYNWVETERGREVLSEIQDRAKKDKTFAPENKTYSFQLTPADMKHIKNYNDEKDSQGGYSDYDMVCYCPSKDADSYQGPCVRCKSNFVTELSKGNVKYDGTNHNVTGWRNTSLSLENVRNSNKNW